MCSLKLIADRIINLPIALIRLAIIKLPFFSKYKCHLLSTCNQINKRSRFDNFLFRVFFAVWLRFEYLKEANLDEREKLKSFEMGGDSGINWAQN